MQPLSYLKQFCAIRPDRKFSIIDNHWLCEGALKGNVAKDSLKRRLSDSETDTGVSRV